MKCPQTKSDLQAKRKTALAAAKQMLPLDYPRKKQSRSPATESLLLPTVESLIVLAPLAREAYLFLRKKIQKALLEQ